tara:strand:+ start:396 stop:1013 length:618 start_codon:yes stop_codon:yes gene_type:complete
MKMIKELTKLANELDSRGLTKEADFIDQISKKAVKVVYPDRSGVIPQEELMSLMELRGAELGDDPEKGPSEAVRKWVEEELGEKGSPEYNRLTKSDAGDAVYHEPDDEDLAPWQKGQWARDRDAMLAAQQEDPPFFSGNWAKEMEAEMRSPVLETHEIVALIEAHLDTSTDFKLDPYPGRLDGLQFPDLTDEEKAIISGSASSNS